MALLLAAGSAIGSILSAPPTGAEEVPTIHHAGVIRAIDLAAGQLVVAEGPRVGPAALTTIRVTSATTVIRLGREGGTVVGKPVALFTLQPRDYVVVRGIDRDGEHLAEVIWSFGPPE